MLAGKSGSASVFDLRLGSHGAFTLIIAYIKTFLDAVQYPKSTTHFPMTCAVTPDGVIFSKTTRKMQSQTVCPLHNTLSGHRNPLLTADFEQGSPKCSLGMHLIILDPSTGVLS